MFRLIIDYCVTLIKEMVHLAIMMVTSVLLSMGLVYSYAGAWQLYTHTQIGERFFQSEPELSHQIVIFLAQGTAWPFSLEIAVLSTVVSLCLAIILQLFFVRHLFYTNIPLIFKGILCISLAAGLAKFQMEAYHLTNFHIAILLFSPFMLVLFPTCMSIVPKLVPNLGQMMIFLLEMMRDLFGKYK